MAAELNRVGVIDMPERTNRVTASAYARPSRDTVCE